MKDDRRAVLYADERTSGGQNAEAFVEELRQHGHVDSVVRIPMNRGLPRLVIGRASATGLTEIRALVNSFLDEDG